MVPSASRVFHAISALADIADLERERVVFGSGQVQAGNSQCSYSFAAANEPQSFICCGLDGDSRLVDIKCMCNGGFHGVDVWGDFGFLGDNSAVHIDDLSAAQSNHAGGFLKEQATWGIVPAGIGVWEKVADVALAEGAKDCITYRMHERVGVRVPFEAFRIVQLDASENELSAGDQLVDVVSNANVNHRVKR